MGSKAKTNSSAASKPAGLGDTELILLAAGGKREDRLIEAPAVIKPSARQRAAGNLLKRGLVEEVPASSPDGPVWREGENTRIALRITDAGLAAIGIEAEPVEVGTPGAGGPPSGRGLDVPGTVEPDRPREGSKGALLVGMLTRPQGTSVADLQAATGWLPHTVRAALTGLRRRGYAISREVGQDGASRYRIILPEPVAPKPARRSRKAAPEQAGLGA